ncbi:MAG: histidine kinase, partial [Bacteroidales bacterium]|nr:histidine kinase [Bacteroidales bacterium]
MKVPLRKNQPSRLNLTDLMIFKNRWWQHLVFWGVALLILFNIFKGSGSVEKIDVIFTFIFLVPIVTIVYLNLYLAVPRFLRREKYLLYTLILLILIGGGALFLYLLFDRWIDLLLPGYYFISYYNVPVLMLYTGSFLVLTTLLKLSRSWFMLLRVERMTTTHQLQSLQSQINPHFLLNSLQTIYALSLERSERSPEVILQLSGILKYTLYETGQPTVELEKEIGMIRDYVEMYRHRVDPDRTDIKLEVDGDPGALLIAPMLLIPFIENSFKHGLRGSPGEAFVHIHMTISGQKLQFRIQNSRGETDRVEPEQQKGIGIDNTRQRLELLYPGKHTIDIETKEDTFTVNLSIEL